MGHKIKSLLPILIIVLVIGAGIYLLAKNNDEKISTNLPIGYEYYWGNGCPHCATVAEFLNTWSGKDKVQIDKKEVWNNQTNYRQMQVRAEYCKLDKNNLGVPMLFTPDGQCLVGDEPIISLFKSLNLEN